MTKHVFFFVGVCILTKSLLANEPLQFFLDSLHDTKVENIGETLVEEALEPKTKITIDIPYTEHALIDTFRQEYLSAFGKKKLTDIMHSATPYREHIQNTLRSYEIPLCIEFLPVIESDFYTKAVSRSGATGLWQFMENSIKGYLKKDDWIDERYDPWLSTVAAAKKLSYNYSVLKNWELALAAYNMGLNGLMKIMKEANSSDFWYLVENDFLRTETKNYVPKFLAIADIITNAEYYGLDIPPFNPKSELNFEVITLTNQLDIEIFSQVSDINYSNLILLNPAIKGKISPPYEYFLRVPEGFGDIAKKSIASIEKEKNDTLYAENVQKYKTHTVTEGETLWGLSRKYKTSVAELCRLNNRLENDILSIGTVLFLPIIK